MTDVVVYGAGANGGRNCSFECDGISVLVRSSDEDLNERALRLAHGLIRSARTITEQAARLAAQERELEALRARVAAIVPPNAPPARLLGRGCVRFRNGAMFLLNKREHGWSSFGVICDGWDDLFRRYNVAVVAHGTDDTGAWWEVENVAPRRAGGE